MAVDGAGRIAQWTFWNSAATKHVSPGFPRATGRNALRRRITLLWEKIVQHFQHISRNDQLEKTRKPICSRQFRM